LPLSTFFLITSSFSVRSKKPAAKASLRDILKEKDLSSISRKKEIVKPRQVAMFLLRELLKSSYPFIGRKFGGKDHTTAIYACEKIVKELKDNDNLNNEVDLIKQRIFSA
jgi:chromosomal replication initiator protein